MTKRRLVFLILLLGITLSLTSLTSISASHVYHSSVAFAQSIAANRPNILIIMGDDLGYSDIGSFGSEIKTPNLDALAKNGIILTNYHAMPTCSPSRTALLTGVDNHIGGLGSMAETLAPNQIGKPGYEGYINHKVVTIAELLRDADYNTMMAGKWHLSGHGYHNGTTPYDRGFRDSFSLLQGGANHFNSWPERIGEGVTFVHNNAIVPRPDNTTYSADLYTNILIDQIKKVQGNGKPLFMYLSFQEGHSPFQAPQAFISKYEGAYHVGYDKIREERFAKQKALGLWPANTTLPKEIPPQSWDSLTPEEQNYRAKVLAVHAAMIEDMDYNIGKLIQYLKSIGKYANTLVIFASDNGSSEPIEMDKFATDVPGATKQDAKAFLSRYDNTVANLGTATSFVNYGAWGTSSSVTPFSGFKSSMGEGGTRVPIVIKLPQQGSSSTSSITATTQSRPKIINAFVDVTDISPTLLDYTGVRPPGPTYHGFAVHPIMGKSIRPLLEGKVQSIRADNEPIAKEFGNNTAVWMGSWKAVKNNPPISDGKWHLYNYVTDIGETKDLGAQHPDILAKMTSYYNKYAKNVGVIVPSGGSALEQALDQSTP
jgi:arylsulfatase A-like enzyme